MDKYVWLMEMWRLQDRWKYATMVYGVEYVTTCGILMMLELHAGNLGSQIKVSNT